jgi:hypothetical protein
MSGRQRPQTWALILTSAVLGVLAAACASARKPARSATSQLTASTAAASAGH